MRINWIDAAKGACILAVVLYHFNQFVYQGMYEGHTIALMWNVVISALKPLRMPLFFLISGYLAATSINKRSWARIRTKKIASLLWVYVLWASLYWLVVDQLLPANPWYDSTAEANATLMTRVYQLLTADTSLWYLYALVIYFVLVKALRSPVLGIVAGVASNIAMPFIVPTDQWGLQSLMAYFLFFVIGVHAREFINTHYMTFSVKRFVLTASISMAGLGAASHFDLLYAPGVQMLLALVMVSTVIDLFALTCNYFRLQWLCSVGQQTLPIYVMHQILIKAAAPFMPPIINTPLMVLEPILATMLVAAACLMLYRILVDIRGRALFTMPHTLRRIAYRTHMLQPAV
ncbi:acyltransferase family protein [Kushneria konosiri]|uniref:acyltransferase family protein n=1 Tax=Kushneria konosiri TaxID=698828 RepID=UPI0013140142|nr:acyltransferase family protein [Kushneria konosiri]